jgi:predicted phosphodiesterase
MKLLIFSDIHAGHRALEKLMETDADLYFAAGDLVNWVGALSVWV